ncbi:MAG: permease-like cell division protein FtsX [Bacteroidota bacterium]|nr:permease-like cell division protein FtsX [Bacteroidota bacterium]
MQTEKSKIINIKILSSSFSVVISLSLVLFIIGVLSLILLNANRLSNYAKENIGFIIMLEDNVKEAEITKFQKILDASNFCKSTSFVSKEQATRDLQIDLGEDFVDFLGYSPLLASIDITLNANYANSDSLNTISVALNKNPIVHEVYYQKYFLDQLNKNVKNISFALLSFCILLFVISFTLINNTIRLSIYAKRFLMQTMRLVGATDQFIRKPFLIKSLYHGFYASVFAIFLLIITIQLVQNEIATILNINDLKIIGVIFILIFVVGMLLSWCSTFFAVRKYTHIKENKIYN